MSLLNPLILRKNKPQQTDEREVSIFSFSVAGNGEGNLNIAASSRQCITFYCYKKNYDV
jgi:hypothetical protein